MHAGFLTGLPSLVKKVRARGGPIRAAQAPLGYVTLINLTGDARITGRLSSRSLKAKYDQRRWLERHATSFPRMPAPG